MKFAKNGKFHFALLFAKIRQIKDIVNRFCFLRGVCKNKNTWYTQFLFQLFRAFLFEGQNWFA